MNCCGQILVFHECPLLVYQLELMKGAACRGEDLNFKPHPFQVQPSLAQADPIVIKWLF